MSPSPAGARPRRAPAPMGLLPLAAGLVAGVGVLVAPQAWPLLGAGLLGLALALRSPLVPAGAMFVAVLFDQMGPTGKLIADLPVTASKLSVVAALGLWVWTSWTRRRPLVRWHPVLGALVALVATTALSIVHGGDFDLGKFELFGLGMLTVLVGLVHASLAEEPLDPLYRALALAFVAVLGLSLLAPSLDPDSERVTGTMGDPNEWGTTVLLVTPFLLGGLARAEGWAARGLRMGLVGLAPLAVMASESRSAALAGLLTAPFWLLLLRHHKGEVLGVGALGTAAVPFVLDLEHAVARLQGLVEALRGGGVSGDNSLTERSELLRQGLDLFREHWVLGVGAGRFGVASGFVDLEGGTRPAHNTYLQVAAEQGVVGLLALGAVGVTVAVAFVRGWRQAPRTVDRDRLLGLLGGLAATALMAATLGLLTLAMAYLVLGVGLAVLHQARGPRVHPA